MRAIKVVKPFEIQIVDVPKPVIEQEDDVIVRITSGGICGSDIGIWNGTNSLATYPRIIGHEFGGIVEEVGTGVTDVNVGDQVAVDPVISCGHCYACTHGRHNVCSSLEVMGVHKDGGFSEFVKARANNIHRFSKPFDESLLGIVEPYTIGVQINHRGEIKAGDKVLIMGAGPIGICAMQVAKGNGAEVMMSDIVKERLEKAVSMGADEIVLVSEESLEDRIREFTHGEGMPVVVDTVCSTKSFEQAVSYTCPAGRVVCIGLKSQPSEIAMADITKKEVTIVGSRLNNNCFDEVIIGFEQGSLKPDELVTKVFNYKEVEDAFAMITEHPQDVLKLVLKFED